MWSETNSEKGKGDRAMRLIDADTLEKEICSGCEYNKSKYANCDDCAIDNAPTIDAEPVKHGEWVVSRIGESTSWFVECSKCNVVMPPVNYTYCPNCGAKMDKD